MTAPVLSLEDLERLIRWGERSDLAEHLAASQEALRSVMAERDALAEHAEVRFDGRPTTKALLDEAREQVRSLTVERDEAIADFNEAERCEKRLAKAAVSVVVAASEQRNASGGIALLGSAAKLARAIDALAEVAGETPKNWSPSYDPVKEERNALRARLSRAREALPDLLDNLESTTAALAVHDSHEADLQRFRSNPALERDAAEARAAVLAALADEPPGGP